MLSIIEKVIFLQNVDVFSEVSTEQLAYLAAIADEVPCMPDDEIFQENEHADALYLVLEGRIQLHRGETEITVLGPGEAFGTWALFDAEPRVATATATEPGRLLKIDREDFYDILADHVQVTQGIMKALVKRLRGLVDRVT